MFSKTTWIYRHIIESRTFSGTLLLASWMPERMTTLTASAARAKLYKLLDQATAAHEPIQITGKRGNAILVSEEDWHSIQETLYLLSIPDMRGSVRKGLKTPERQCARTLHW